MTTIRVADLKPGDQIISRAGTLCTVTSVLVTADEVHVNYRHPADNVNTPVHYDIASRYPADPTCEIANDILEDSTAA
jgi:hypothetical protein